MKRTLPITLTLFALSGSTLAMNGSLPINDEASTQSTQRIFRCGTPPTPQGQAIENKQQAYIDVVFVLDTTGSMGGLIEGAKQKIWSIANTISQAQQTPIIRFGLVGYRDRGDEYVTRLTPLTEDIDTVYSDLMEYKAQGGGDTPESVNEALFAAVERFEWSEQPGALKMVYLVGDAPPKMEYPDDVKYQASCRLASEQGINVNTIQCGNLNGTQAIWQEIAQLANGSYAAIQQNGGVVAISTPYDEQLATLDSQIRATMLDYGNAEMYAYQEAKRGRASDISAVAAPEAAADRAMYNSSSAGRRNMLGKQELVDDIATGKIQVEEVEKDQLPKELQKMSDEELKADLERRKEQRAQLTKKVKDLAAKRRAYLNEHTPKAGLDGFDQKVRDALIEQGSRVGITFESDKTEAETEAGTDHQEPEPKDSSND